MYIKELKLNNFRNYEEASLTFNKDSNIIKGKNGQGKTNLLESIYILSMGKSFRTLKDAEMIKFGKDKFSIKGLFYKDEEDLSVEIKLQKKEKRIIIDGVEKKKNADLLEKVYTVIFSPDDLRIVKDDPKKRRKFMDRELFMLKPLYYIELSKYKKALDSRNTLLREEKINEDLLDIYDTYLAKHGAKIIKNRRYFINKLDEASREIENKITDEKEELKVTYESNIELLEDDEEQIKLISYLLKINRNKDIMYRTTSIGPQKDDLKITINGIDLRKYGSQGQHKTAAISLKLAELKMIKKETNEEAILLLDDVLSELDEERQKKIINSFETNQLFITSADYNEQYSNNFASGYSFIVEKGKVKREEN